MSHNIAPYRLFDIAIPMLVKIVQGGMFAILCKRNKNGKRQQFVSKNSPH